MDAIVDDTPDHGPILGWLASDWAFTTEAGARRLARPVGGLIAWVAFDAAALFLFHAFTVVGLPLVVLWLMQRRGPPPGWALGMIVALAAFVTVIGWTNGPAEWTSGIGEFKLLLVLFTARCEWAELAAARLRRQSEVIEAFS